MSVSSAVADAADAAATKVPVSCGKEDSFSTLLPHRWRRGAAAARYGVDDGTSTTEPGDG